MATIPWPITPGAVYTPRWRVLVNGVAALACDHVEIRQTGHRRAGTLNASFALQNDPALLAALADAQPPISIEVQASMLAAGQTLSSATWTSIFVGDCNDPTIDPIKQSADVTALDLAGRLIVGKTTENFANKSASAIAEIIAARFNLTADVDPTDGLAGAFYQLQHDKMTATNFSRATTYWNLLSYLASEVGYDLYVTGRTLHFKAPVDIAQPSYQLLLARDPVSGILSAPVEEIKLTRSCDIAKGIKVSVRIWSSKEKKATTIPFPTGAAADAQEYTYLKPDFSPQKALEFAQAQYNDILRHERTVEIEMCGEMAVDCRSTVSITGTGTQSFDTTYFVDEISREWSAGRDGGFTQRLMLKNHPVQSDATVD